MEVLILLKIITLNQGYIQTYSPVPHLCELLTVIHIYCLNLNKTPSRFYESISLYNVFKTLTLIYVI